MESCIFLEDDTIPDLTFFPFCAELLHKFWNNPQIATISGTKFFTGYKSSNTQESYFFSRYPQLWGWATWKWKWGKYYDPDLSDWDSVKTRRRIVKSIPYREEIVWRGYWDEVYKNKIDTWDRQLGFSFFRNNLLSVIPSTNLVSNIGFGHPDATHTLKESWQGNLKSRTLQFPLKHPISVSPERNFDKLLSNHFAPTLRTRLRNKLGRTRNFLISALKSSF